MSLLEIKLALEALARRIMDQRRKEADRSERDLWTEELNRTRDLIDLVELAINGDITL